MYRVYDCLEQYEALRRQADAATDYYTGIICGSQVTLNGLQGRFIRTDQTKIALPSRSVISFSATAIPARIFSTFIPGGKAGLEKSTVSGS